MKRQTTHERDPLDCIPSVLIITHRLRDAEQKARRLRVLLKTAMEIAGEGESAKPDGEDAQHE